MEQTPGYGVIVSSGGMTTPSTSVAGMAGYVAPLLGLPLPDFSSWSLPPPEAPLPQGLPAASQGLSHVRRSIQVRATVERQVWAQLVQGPRGLMLCTPQMRCLSISHCLASCQLHTDRRCSCPASPPGGESHLTPPWIKLPPLPVQVHRTTGDLQLGSREARADLPAALGCRRR